MRACLVILVAYFGFFTTAFSQSFSDVVEDIASLPGRNVELDEAVKRLSSKEAFFDSEFVREQIGRLPGQQRPVFAFALYTRLSELNKKGRLKKLSFDELFGLLEFRDLIAQMDGATPYEWVVNGERTYDESKIIEWHAQTVPLLFQKASKYEELFRLADWVAPDIFGYHGPDSLISVAFREGFALNLKRFLYFDMHEQVYELFKEKVNRPLSKKASKKARRAINRWSDRQRAPDICSVLAGDLVSGIYITPH